MVYAIVGAANTIWLLGGLYIFFVSLANNANCNVKDYGLVAWIGMSVLCQMRLLFSFEIKHIFS